MTTFTVVGYGNDMPSAEKDSGILVLFILFGVLLFSSFAGQVQVLFNNYSSVFDINTHLDQIEENIDVYSIKHNQLWNVKQLNISFLNEWKLVSKIVTHFGYRNLQDDPMF